MSLPGLGIAVAPASDDGPNQRLENTAVFVMLLETIIVFTVIGFSERAKGQQKIRLF